MSPKAKPAPAASSDDTTCDKNLHTLSDSIELAQKFTAAVGALASHQGYRNVAELIDEIPRLRDAAVGKDREIECLYMKIRELEEDTEKASRHLVKVYEREYDVFKGEKIGLTTQIKSLEKKTEVQDQEITRLVASENDLKEKGRQIKGMWTAEKEVSSQARKRVHELEEETRKTASENSRLGGALKQVQAEVSTTKDSLRSCEDRALGLERELRATKEGLEELKRLGVRLTREDWEEPVRHVEDLWLSARQLVESHIGKDLSVDILNAPDSWALLRTPLGFQHQIPLPASNSPAAKTMRTTTVLAIMARLIDKHIFQPTYILEGESGMRDLLLRQAALHSKKESYTRALLLSMFPEEQRSTANRKASQVLQEMKPYIRHLLSQNEMDTFQEELRVLVNAARDAWFAIQRLEERLEPSFKLVRFDDYEWKTIQPATTASDRKGRGRASTTQADQSEAVLMVFPRISLVEDEEEPYPLTRGTVITKAEIEAASQELQKAASKPSAPRLLSARSRRPGYSDSSQKDINPDGLMTANSESFLEQNASSGKKSGG